MVFKDCFKVMAVCESSYLLKDETKSSLSREAELKQKDKLVLEFSAVTTQAKQPVVLGYTGCNVQDRASMSCSPDCPLVLN